MHQPLPSLLHATQQGARCMVKPPKKEKEKEKMAAQRNEV